MKFVRQLFLIIFVLVSVADVGLAANSSSNDKKQKHPNSYYYKQFQEVFERIQRSYVQTPELQEMTDEAIHGMLRSLDPYSSYYVDEDLDFFISQTDGEFGGIGVEIIYDSGAVKVITPIDDLPAYNAGIRAGDYILGVNGELVSNMGFNKAVQEMRGEPGTKLNLLVISEDENKPREVELTRKIVKIEPIKHEIEFDELGVIGYVRIVAFNNKTTDDLKKAIKTIQRKAMEKKTELKGLILDVRSNPGGLLDQAALVAEYFIDHGTIVTATGKNGKREIHLTAGRFVEKAPNVPMVVLINSGTASSSEIVAGALQDHKRAIVVGTTSFGKGLVQTFTQINKRAAVKLTTQKYFTPSGRSINAKGIEPDIYIEPADVKYAEKDALDKKFTSSSIKNYLRKYNKDEKKGTDKDDDEPKSIDEKDAKDRFKKPTHELSEKYKKDYQYARAYDLIRGLILNESKKSVKQND